MTYLTKPKFHHPALPKNTLGFTHRDYEGSISTLCAGCGHDSISSAIIEACFELDVQPHRLAKLSGIGCSSKTPDYFLGNSHGFNTDSAIDTVSLALLMGATYVARSFSGDKKQLVPLIKAGLAHKGSAFIDVISPCVAFNNHDGSTKSYDYIREHNEAVNRLDFWPTRDAIGADYAEGEVIEVPAGAEGGILRLRKLHEDYDPSDKINATSMIASAAVKGEVLT